MTQTERAMALVASSAEAALAAEAMLRERYDFVALDEWVGSLRVGWFYLGQFFQSCSRERGTSGAHLPPV